MRIKVIHIILVCFLLLLLKVNSKAQNTSGKELADVRIAWDYSSLHQMAEEGGYPRLIRLRNGNLMAVYENRRGDIHLIKSENHGNSWSVPEVIFSSYPFHVENSKESIRINATNPEIIELSNGDILFACNYRPRKDNIAPFSIGLKRLNLRSNQLSDTEILYEAGKKFKDGCWEPSFLQLLNGELHLYFANESPFRASDEQEISVLKSNDNGESWSDPETASFRKDRRDGMPVAVISKDKIYLAVEDNKIGQFKPYIIQSSINQSWGEPVTANSENRWYALEERVDDSVYMGAPYLLKLPNDQFLISYQTNRDRNHNWELSTMEVAIGDKNARSFKNISQPFPVAINKEAKWNSIANWDKNTVVALSSTNFNSEKISPWMIKGYLIPSSVKLKQDTVQLFIGSLSAINLKAEIYKSNDKLEISLEGNRKDSNSNTMEYILYIRSDKKTEKIVIPVKGKDNTIKKSISLSKLSNNFNLGITLKYSDRSGNIIEEKLVHMDEQNPDTWINFEK